MSRIRSYFKELNEQNKDTGYKKSLEKSAPALLSIFSFISVGMLLLFGLLDPFYHFNNQPAVWGVRGSSIFLLLANYAMYFYVFKKNASARTFILSGYYITVIFTTLLANYTGQFQSPYWTGVLFQLVIWLFAAPFNYKARIFHGFNYLAFYFIILGITSKPVFWEQPLAEFIFYVCACFIGGCLTAILSNSNSTKLYFKEKALIDSRTKYRNLIEQATDGIIITQKGLFVFVNQAFCSMMGYHENEVFNTQYCELIKESKIEHTPETNEANIKSQSRRFIYNAKGLRKDGRLIEMELNATIINYNDAPASFIILRDLSERRKAEEDLRKANERLMLHIQHTPLGYIEWDENLKVVEWNPASEKIFGFSKQQTLGKNAYEFLVPDNQIEYEGSLWKELLTKDEGTYAVCENITALGNHIYCEWFNTPLKNQYGKTVGIASLIQDETERRQLEKELKKSHAVLKKDYSITLQQVKTVSEELKEKENQLLKLQKDHLQSQLDSLKNQVNPHFLFNSLNVLSSIISVNPDLAETFTAQLSKTYRYILEHRSEDLVSLATELDFLQAYVFLIQIRFADKLKVNINIPEEFKEKKIPPLVLQILIENVTKHNTFSVKSPLNVDVFVDQDQYLNIVNNLQKRESQIKSTGLGLQNITNRYSYFTDKKVCFAETGNAFVARIPLL